MKIKTVFVCQECGYESQKWLGKCPSCNNWNTLVEEAEKKTAKNAPAVRPGTPPKKLAEISADTEERMKTGIGELDLVLGGGVVLGSLVLVGGEPGIGKSTLLLQICDTLTDFGNVLYVSGEESERQLKMRAGRLSIESGGLYIMGETNIEAVLEQVEKTAPKTVIVDSIQTMYSQKLESAAGSVSQVREVTMMLMRIAKENGISVFVVGHVTKDGSIAGPRVLEHMVDCVLYFEGERHHSYRVLRAVKNRFGSTNEIGVFEMSDKGLIEVKNPSAMLLRERPSSASGSSVACAMEGSRPILAEIQALVTPSGFGIPRRMASGMDYNRINLLIAVLEKRAGLNFQNQDVYVNIVGGIKIDETAADLPAAAAMASSLKNIEIPPDMVFMGELGLTGELRSVSQVKKRALEAVKMGFKRIVVPMENAKTLKGIDGEILPAAGIRQAFKYFL